MNVYSVYFSLMYRMGFVGELLSDTISVGADYVLPCVTSGGLGKVMNIINKMKSAGIPQLTELMNHMPFVNKLNDIKSKTGDELNAVLQNPRIEKFYNGIKDKYDKIDAHLCEKLDGIENFLENNTVKSAVNKIGEKLNH